MWVSIHAPRAGCDFSALGYQEIEARVSIHAPRAGCDIDGLLGINPADCFNSRTPCGVRRKCYVLTKYKFCFNSRTPCGVRREFARLLNVSLQVSIHAPRAGCDLFHILFLIRLWCFNSRTPCGVRPTQMVTSLLFKKFQFTHPVRGATAYISFVGQLINVSIHAPRAGCDY